MSGRRTSRSRSRERKRSKKKKKKRSGRTSRSPPSSLDRLPPPDAPAPPPAEEVVESGFVRPAPRGRKNLRADPRADPRARAASIPQSLGRQGWPHKRRPATPKDLQDFTDHAHMDDIKRTNQRLKPDNRVSEQDFKNLRTHIYKKDIGKLAKHIGELAVKEKTAEKRRAENISRGAPPPPGGRAAKREEIEEGQWQAAQAGGREARHMKAEEVAAARRAGEHASRQRDNHGRRAATSSSGSLQPEEHRALPPENSSSAVQTRKRKRGDDNVALPSRETAVSSTDDIRRPPQRPGPRIIVRPGGPQVRPAVAGGAPAPAPPKPPRPSPQPAPERAAPPADAGGGGETPDVEIGAPPPVPDSPRPRAASPDHPVPAPQPPAAKRRKREGSEETYVPTAGEDTDSESEEKPPRRSKREVARPDYTAPPSPAHSASDFLPAHGSSGVTHVHPPSRAPPVPDPQSDPAVLASQSDTSPSMPRLEANAARRTSDALVAASNRGAAPVLPRTDVYAGELGDRPDQAHPDAPEAEVVGRRKKREPIPEEKRSEVPPTRGTRTDTRRSGTVTQTQVGPSGRQAQTEYSTQSATAAAGGRAADTSPAVTWRLQPDTLQREIFDGNRWRNENRMKDSDLAQAVHWHSSEGQEANWPKNSKGLDQVANQVFGYKSFDHMKRTRFTQSSGNLRDVDQFRQVLLLGRDKLHQTRFLTRQDDENIARAHRSNFGGTRARPIVLPAEPEPDAGDEKSPPDPPEAVQPPSMVYENVPDDEYSPNVSSDEDPQGLQDVAQASVGRPARRALNRPRVSHLRFAYHEHRNRQRLEAARQALKNVNLNEHGRWTHGKQFRGSHGRNPTPRLSVQHLGPQKYIFRAYRGVSRGVREQVRHYLSRIRKYVYLNGIRHNKKQAFTAMIDLLRTNKGVEVQIQ